MNRQKDDDLNLELAYLNRRPVPAAQVRARAAAAIQARRRQVRRRRMAAAVILLLLISLMVLTLLRIFSKESTQGSVNNISMEARAANAVLDASGIEGLSINSYLKHPVWTEDYLTPNAYSRPGDPLKQVKSIFVHYTANPGTSAVQNRSYFEQLKDTHITSASSHFIIGYEGEIIQCIPLDEIGYAVATRNEDSISIECCYLEADGSFTEETYQSLVTLLAWLTKSYGLTEDDILRHYDCGGKKCPLYYVEHETAWNTLKADVSAAIAAEYEE